VMRPVDVLILLFVVLITMHVLRNPVIQRLVAMKVLFLAMIMMLVLQMIVIIVPDVHIHQLIVMTIILVLLTYVPTISDAIMKFMNVPTKMLVIL
jgi:hypothetical protein